MKYLKVYAQAVLSFAIILGFLSAGRSISAILPFTFPGSIIGLILLYLCLITGLIRLSWLQPSGNIILGVMAMFFIPAAVGIVQYADLVLSNIWVIAFNVVLGIAVIILVIGHIFQFLDGRK